MSNPLISKAAKLDFSKLPGMTPLAVAPGPSPSSAADGATAAPVMPMPKTAPGALMAFANDARSSLLRENESLRAELSQWEGVKPTRWLDPTLIARSRYANRHELNFSGEAYAQLKDEIRHAGGNVQPIKVRPLPGATDTDTPRYEVVFGHRRLQACRELGLPVLAMVDALDDQALFIEMDRENRTRKDLSAWEQGRMYQRALDEGLFSSNRKLAEAVGVDVGNLGRALMLARLPQEVVEAFASPLDLQFRWAKALNDAAGADTAGLVARARELAARKGQLPAKVVFEQLVQPPTPAGGLYRTTPPVAPVSIQRQGRPVAQVRMGEQGAVNVVFEPGALSAEQLSALARHIEAFWAAGTAA
jgi:ParB family transcriptional regulator, chromosome partitioning protein